jgi:hypothetical protein
LAVTPESQIVFNKSQLLVTADETELGPPLIDWIRPKKEELWWETETEEVSDEKLYYPPLRSGFESGHIVSVPSEEGERECARVIKASTNERSGEKFYEVRAVLFSWLHVPAMTLVCLIGTVSHQRRGS